MPPANDSSTGGYLTPTTSAPTDDELFVDFLQAVVVGITGLPTTLVRPRWQRRPPNQPDQLTNWAAIGIAERRADMFPYLGHVSAGQGDDKLIQHEELDLDCSFYGPNCDQYATLLRDGLAVAQNREVMEASGVVWAYNGPIRPAHELINELWNYRVDFTVCLRRELGRTYPVLNLLSAPGNITVATFPHPVPFNAV